MSKRPLKAADVYQDAQLLRMLGWGILDMERETGVGFEDVHRYAYLVHPDEDRQAISRRIGRLLGRYYPPGVAAPMWEQILVYRAEREREAGRLLPLKEVAPAWYRLHGKSFLRQHYLSRRFVPRRVPGQPERGAGVVEKVVELAIPQLRPLLEAGFSVVDVARVTGPHLGRVFECLVLRRVTPEAKERYYIDLIARLTAYQIKEEQSEELWRQILQHKWYLSERAGQDVGIQAAALDFFKRIKLADDQLDLQLLGDEEGTDASPDRA